MLNKGADGHKLSKVYFETEVKLTIVLRRHPTRIGEIMQNKGHFTVQGHSRSPIFVPIES